MMALIGRRLRPRVLLPGHEPRPGDVLPPPEAPQTCVGCGKTWSSFAQLGWHQYVNPVCDPQRRRRRYDQ